MEPWAIVLIFVIIATIVGLIVWAFWSDISGIRKPEPPVPPVDQKAGFNDPCNTIISCETNLTCSAGLCKRNVGQPCLKLADCVNTASACIKLKVDPKIDPNIPTQMFCTSGSTGTLDKPAPCNEGLVANEDNICKIIPDLPCKKNPDCISNFCLKVVGLNESICAKQSSLGQPCGLGQCETGLICSNGFCQKEGLTTGQRNSFCSLDPSDEGPFCDPEFGCVEIDVLGISENRCLLRTQEFTESCGNANLCKNSLTCHQTLNICVVPTPFNDCSQTDCPNGFICTTNSDKHNKSVCQAQENQVCKVDVNCLSGKCSQMGTFIYKDENETENQTTPIWELDDNTIPNFFDRFEVGNQGRFGLITRDNASVIKGLYRNSNDNWILIHPGVTCKYINGDKTTTELTDFTIHTCKSSETIYTVQKISRNSSSEWVIGTLKLMNDGSGKITPFIIPITSTHSLTEVNSIHLNRKETIAVIATNPYDSENKIIYTKEQNDGFFKVLTLINSNSTVKNVTMVRWYEYKTKTPNEDLSLVDATPTHQHNQRHKSNEKVKFTGMLEGTVFPSNELKNDHHEIIPFEIHSIAPVQKFKESIDNFEMFFSLSERSNKTTKKHQNISCEHESVPSNHIMQVRGTVDLTIPGHGGEENILHYSISANETFLQSRNCE